MNCPFCERALPENHSGACPGCGSELASKAPPPLASMEEAPAQRVRTNWLVFFAVLFAPPVLTILAVRAGRSTNDLAPGVALLGGALAGIICGAMLGRHLGRTPEAKFLFGLLSIGALGCASIGMSFFGCLAAGFNLNLH